MKNLKYNNKKIEGLGDWIEQKITEPLGVKTAVETITKAVGVNDCGCKGRKEKLNKLIPFKK